MKNPRFKQGLKWLIFSAILVLISLGGWLIIGLSLNSKNRNITVETITATEDKVEDRITGESGILKLNNQRAIKSPITGTVEQILVKPGDLVKKGQILLRLRDQEIQLKAQELESDLTNKNIQIKDKQISLQLSKTQLETAQKEYQRLQNNYLSEITKLKQDQELEITKSQLEVTRKQQALDIAQNNVNETIVKLDEDRQLLDQGFIAENTLQETEKKLVENEHSLTNAKDDLKLSNIELEKQQLELKKILQNIDQETSEPQQKLKEARLKLAQEQQNLKQAQLALSQTILERDKLSIERQKIAEQLRQNLIISPEDSKILNIPVKVGDVVDQKADLLLIGDPSQQIVEVNLSPLDATKVQLNQKAEIGLIGSQGEKLTGKVTDVSLLAGDGQSSDNQSSETVKVKAVVKLDQTDQEIVIGTPVTVDLIIASRENVITIPNEAMQRDDTITFVWIKDPEGKARKKAVEIGLQGLTNLEIKSGLEAGEEILIPPLDNMLQDGNSVTIK
jgi:HlyD family secretion protein